MRLANDLDDAVVIGLVGFGVWELHKAYCEQAPKLMELRRHDADDTEMRQALMDADTSVGGLALFGGAAASLMLRTWWPILIIGGAFAFMSWYHHDTLRGPSPITLDTLASGANNKSWSTQPTL